MAKFSVTGIDEFEKELKTISNKAEKFGKKKQHSYNKVFNSTFLKKHTKFSSFKKMMEASNFDCSTQEKFDSIPKEDLDKFIQSISRYRSFDNMLKAASEDYLVKELGL